MAADCARGREICAIFVTFHPDAEFPRRVAAVAAQVGGIVIVDNGSGADALSMLDALGARQPSVETIANGANLGVARALNVGIERAAARGFAWVLLFDQDSEAAPDLVRGLLEVRDAFADARRLGVVGAGYETGAAPAPGTPPGGLWDEVENVITSGSLIALPVLREIGPFREELFIDYVDIDFCRRARARGFAVLQTTRPLMRHSIGTPTRHRVLGAEKWTTNHSPDRRYYIARNDTVMLRESGDYPHGAWVLKSLGRRLRTCRRVLMLEHDKSAKVAATLQGWWHGVCHRLGPRPG